jgi:glutathione synthase
LKLLVLTNSVWDLKAPQTTTALLCRAATLGHEVWATGVADLELTEPRAVLARARRVPAGLEPTGFHKGIGPREKRVVSEFDAVLIRTNPARDDARRWAHRFALEMLELAEEQGTRVINQPQGVRRLGGKPGCMLLPRAIRPRTLITRDPGAIRKFLKDEGRCVIKPASGTHGRGVFILQNKDPNMRAAVEVLSDEGMVVVQEWIPEAVDGDVRLFVVNGEILREGGHAAAVRRRPAKGELRSNVHLGGTPEPVEITPALERIGELAGPVLMKLGVAVAGLDCIGDRVVEINAFAPGGLADCEKFYGVDFVDALLRRLL